MMDIVYVLVNVAILLAIIGLLIMMQKKHISFTKRVFTGLGFGIVLGAILQAVYGTGSDVLAETTGWYDVVGSGYIRLLMMIVVPLVMVSIIQDIINLEKTSELGKMSTWIIGILFSTAMGGELVGIGSAALSDQNADQIDAGQAETDRGIVLESTLDEVQETSAAAKILDFIP